MADSVPISDWFEEAIMTRVETLGWASMAVAAVGLLFGFFLAIAHHLA